MKPKKLNLIMAIILVISTNGLLGMISYFCWTSPTNFIQIVAIFLWVTMGIFLILLYELYELTEIFEKINNNQKYWLAPIFFK